MCKIATIVASVFPSIAIILNDFFWKLINTEISNFFKFYSSVILLFNKYQQNKSATENSTSYKSTQVKICDYPLE
jgi:hypothetical protein